MINPFQWYWVWIVLTSIVVVFPFLAVGIWGYYRRTRFTFKTIRQLFTRVEYQDTLLSKELYYRQLGEKLSKIVDRYHTPHKRWKEYETMKRDLSPWIHAWICKLDTFPLSEREKVFCIISLVYSHMTDVQIAEYLCYDKAGIRVFKQRVAKKIGTTSANLLDSLRNLPLG